jgi:hypothetical protein
MSGQAGAELERRTQSVIAAARRHLDVDHRRVGLVGERLSQEALRVARLGDDLEARLHEQSGDPFPQEHIVLAQNYSDGSSHAPKLPVCLLEF